MRMTKGAPGFAGSPDTVSYLLSIANLANCFSGTTWDWTSCCPGPACCEPIQTAIKTTRMSSVDMPLPDGLLLRQRSTSMENRQTRRPDGPTVGTDGPGHGVDAEY